MIHYDDFRSINRGLQAKLLDLAAAAGAQAVAELGGGANPYLADPAWDGVPTRAVYDISADELAKSGAATLDLRQADLCQPLDVGDAFDLVFSRMLCEHLQDPATFHRNCWAMLRPGGLAVHHFPTLSTLPFLVNRLLPERAARAVLARVRPGRIGSVHHEKFPATYRWCHGPTSRPLQRFSSIGFEVVEWVGGFGHAYYERVPPLDAIERRKTEYLLRHPVPWLTSFAVVVLRKPPERASRQPAASSQVSSP